MFSRRRHGDGVPAPMHARRTPGGHYYGAPVGNLQPEIRDVKSAI